MAQTPAIAAVERAGVAFSLHEYEHDPGADSYGLEAAEKLGVDPARLFKTLVADVDGALTVACVPAAVAARPEGAREAGAAGRQDPRANGRPATSAAGSARSASAAGCRPVIDASALEHETILVSAGRRGLQIELDPRDLVRLTDATSRPIAAPLR